jgi:putative FmdB family regulatory protein
MPTYEFRCQECEQIFELSCSISEFERASQGEIKCSRCGSSKVKQQVAVFQAQTSKKS